ncbi:MAG: cytochrome ubiquinol oxidase subunit I [Prevotella sp.]|nr:cytochrome ubiquinol oxidase subunit I [Prevotella sp.]MCI5855677.1 cytochrome ubiquinol oxidase subunit I [Prevotella sp.]MDY6091596.1 cytochrome ubiquinol oxidase subunit I [Prevotella sp.]
MLQYLLNIDAGAIDWARAQFALTAIYHWLFVPLTLGLALIMGIMETCYYRTRDVFWKHTAQFWQKLFGINFAMGVATGIILEFEFGTNWSNYSWFVGDIFGAPLAVEGIIAFFMESTFVAVMFFGWKKVSAGFHLASTWLTGLGATFSAWWILVANAWMQYPVGCTFNPDTMRNEMTSFLEVALSPFAVNKFLHTVTSAWIIGALFTVAVGCYYLYHHREEKLATASIKIGGIVGLLASLFALHSGDNSAYRVAQVQPMKLAAMEALYRGGNDQALTAIALVNPFSQPDYATEEEPPLRIAAPYALSFLATRDIHGFVPGINDLLEGGYTRPDGTVEPSVDEKIARGRQAINDLQQYRELKASTRGKEVTAAQQQQLDQLANALQKNMTYFGYGYVKDKEQLVPYIPICFYAFRAMVGLGSLFILFFIVVLFIVYKRQLSQYRWLLLAGMAMLPLGYIASESGWLVAEFGRQPWAIQDMLPTWVGVSNVGAGSVMLTFFIFLALFTTLLLVEINILWKQIKKGPEHEQ